MQDSHSYRNILVAVDLEHRPEEIIAKAVSLANQAGAKIWVIYVATPIDDALYASGLSLLPPVLDFGNLQKNAIAAAEGKLHEFSQNFSGCLIEHKVLLGQPAQKIVDAAEKNQADLIVIGSHGKKGLRLLLGSTATAVLHHARCDTLAIRL